MLENLEIQENKNVVRDLDSASKTFKKIKFLDEEIEKIKEQAKKERAEIEEWEKSEVKILEGKRNYFSGLIEYYYREQKHINSKFRLSTPWGKVSCRTTHNLIVDDETGLICYFELNDKQALRIKKELDKNYIKSKYKYGVNSETGEVLPNIKFVEEEKVSIITTKEKK